MITPVNILTQWTPLFKARATNQTSATFVAKPPQAAEPADDTAAVTSGTNQVWFDMNRGCGFTQNGLKIMPIGVGNDNTTFSLRVYAWERYGSDSTTYIWWPTLLLEAACTIDVDIVGLAGRLLGTSDVGVDTITLVGTSGNANVSHELVSPADGKSQAHIIVDTKGAERVEITFSTGSSATSCNALVKQF